MPERSGASAAASGRTRNGITAASVGLSSCIQPSASRPSVALFAGSHLRRAGSREAELERPAQQRLEREDVCDRRVRQDRGEIVTALF